jgi:hypothetical protein
MLDQVPDVPPAAESAETSAAAPAPLSRPAAPLVIDILAPAPSLFEDCPVREADPFQSEIIVCQQAKASPRLTKSIGPELDDFGNSVPRARLKLSEHAEAEANLINMGVGGWNANGAEVRLKIDF